MLDKNNIIKILNKYNLPKEEYIILSGASMVLQEIKQETSDIDIAVSKSLYNFLIQNFNCILEKEIDGIQIWFINNELNFSTNYYDVEFTKINDYKVQTLESVLNLKLNLNRDKDKKDIEYLKNMLRGE